MSLGIWRVKRLVNELLEIIGIFLVVLGGLLNIIGSIGMLRFPSYFLRIHAATVAVIGGSVVPLVGIAFLSYGIHGSEGVVTSLGALGTAAFIFITAPVSSHAISRAAARMRMPRGPLTHDHLEEDGK
ncbi:MAG: monovalent cation/H(+) antiporter subunit G [Candidatus Verstraetearchaeota archaeon]|nr:monovalent cation/H(+) antiporter subunit G [Candidatus Verstraetearchaeota archaeon]